jgi:hypothetical protein
VKVRQSIAGFRPINFKEHVEGPFRPFAVHAMPERDPTLDEVAALPRFAAW